MTEFRTYVVKISEEGEDRFPFGFSPSDPKTTTTIAGNFDFPLDFEFTTKGKFGAYGGVPNYLKVDSAGRTQYYFLTPISVASPRHENGVAVDHAYKFRAHKDVFASFNVEDITFRPASRIYQGHYLGGYSYRYRNNAYAPDWSINTTRYMPYHLDSIKKVCPLFAEASFRVFIYFTRRSDGTSSGKRILMCTTDPISKLVGSAPSVFDFIGRLSESASLQLNIGETTTTYEIESIDDIYVVPTQIADSASFGFGGSAIFGSGYIAYAGGSYKFGRVVGGGANETVITTNVLEPASSAYNAAVPSGNKYAFEVGCGSSWIKVLPRVFEIEAGTYNTRPSVAFTLTVGTGGVFQLSMSVVRVRGDIQTIDLSQYCSVPFQWRDLNSKSEQQTAAGVQLASSVLQTAASVALAYPTGGVSLVGAIGGASSLIGGYYNYKQVADAPAPSTSGVGSAPGSFVGVSPNEDSINIDLVGGFPLVRVYTLSYADDISGEMCGAYAENPDGEPFTLSIKAQWQLFGTLDGSTTMYPNYIYIRAGAVPFVDRTNYITAYMTEDDVNEFAALLRRGVRLWLGNYSLLYAPAARCNFWAYAD